MSKQSGVVINRVCSDAARCGMGAQKEAGGEGRSRILRHADMSGGAGGRRVLEASWRRDRGAFHTRVPTGTEHHDPLCTWLVICGRVTCRTPLWCAEHDGSA